MNESHEDIVPPGLVLRQLPFTRPGEYRRTAQELWYDAEVILHEVMYEIFIYADQEKEGRIYMPTEDQMTRGVREAISNGKISLWVVFALQAFLDTQQILGKFPQRCSILYFY